MYVSLWLRTYLPAFGCCGQQFFHDRAGKIFGTRASGIHGIGIQSLLHGCTRPQVRAQPNARHHACTFRGECGFSAAWLHFQAT